MNNKCLLSDPYSNKSAKVLWIIIIINNNNNNNNNKNNNTVSASFWNLKPVWGTTGSGGYLLGKRAWD